MELFRLTQDEVLKMLRTSTAGLSHEEARRRLAQHGPNSLAAVRGIPLVTRLLRQFTHFLAILLWIAAGLAFLADGLQPGQGMATLGWAIVGVILINAVFSFIQEYRAERAVHALRRLLPATAWVLRSGQTMQIARADLVPGDLLLLEEGEQVPADARLIQATQMRMDLASLTGEAHPKARRADPVADPAITQAVDAPNLVFAGTTVLSGRGLAVVHETGMRTEFGRIAHLAATVEPGPSPLQKEIVRVTRIVTIFSLTMGLLFFAIGLSVGVGFWVSFVFGVGIIVANVPEGLLPTVTLALAMGSQRMARRKALIKQLTSVETLGCTTVICTDKTGTLTENRMRLDRLYLEGTEIEVHDGRLVFPGSPHSRADLERVRPLLRAIACCNNAKRGRRPDGTVTLTGDPTEVALREFALQQGVMDQDLPRRMGELPFDADRKRMTTIHWEAGKLIAYVKGAPEFMLPLCTRSQVRGRAVPMTPDEQERLLGQSRAFAHQAYRVLAVAAREIKRGAHPLDSETVERDLTFLGLVALMDPPHREVPDAVARCRHAGIRVIMVTGDHPLTALALARKIGLVPEETPQAVEDAVIEGARLDSMTDDELRLLLGEGHEDKTSLLFARMAPRHKMRIVAVLKDMGEVVAVTGDGVNDAPALKKADIGVAMGVAGTDVAKETADMILLDDNFASIVNAIEEGRAVYANIRKFVTYVLASNVPEIVPYLAYGLARAPLALTVPQILAVDLGTDMVPALGLGAERPHPGIMNLPPRPRTERLLSLSLLLRAYGFLGLIEAGIAMAAFFWFLAEQGWTWGAPLDWSDPLYKEATTVTLAAIVLGQVANVFACRSERVSAFQLGFFTNPFILWGLLVELALLALIVYTPGGNFIFGTGPLPVWSYGPLILGAIGLLLAEEIRKLIQRRNP